MIQPINGHFLIEPIKQKSLFSDGEYEEMGKVLAKPNNEPPYDKIAIGDTVYFDSWLSAKYPTGDQNDNGDEIYFWLVRFEDIRAYVQNTIPE